MSPCSTGVTDTSSGFWTSPLTTYSRNACMAAPPAASGDRGRRRGGPLRLANEAGDCFAGLRALGQPVGSPFEVERLFVPHLLLGQVSAQFLDALAVSRAAAVGHDDAKGRSVLGSDAFHADFDRHKFGSIAPLGLAAPNAGSTANAIGFLKRVAKVF